MDEKRACWLVAAWTAALMGCAEEEETVVHEDEGGVCLSQTDSELRAVIPLQQCLSTSCDTDRQWECSLSLEEEGIRIHSRFSYLRSSGPCTADCGTIAARCTMPLPPTGAYTVLLGDQGGEIMLPLGEGTTDPFPTQPRPGGDPCSLFPSVDF
jgi:hypothetical protein